MASPRHIREREPPKLPVPHDFFSDTALCSAKHKARIDLFSSQPGTSDENRLCARQGTGPSEIPVTYCPGWRRAQIIEILTQIISKPCFCHLLTVLMRAWGVGSFVFLHLIIEVVHLGHFVGRRVLGAANSLLLAIGHLVISLGRQLSPDVGEGRAATLHTP